MLPIEPAELSAFLDGELSPTRTDEVRTALARDPELRKSFDQLAALDAEWQARASALMFQPQVRLSQGIAPGRLLITAATILALLLFRIALKSQPPLLASSVEGLLLIVLIGWGLQRMMRATDADRARPESAATC